MANEKETDFLQAIIDTVPSYVSWLSKDFVYRGVNKAAADAFGKKKEDFVGSKLGFSGNGSNNFHRVVKDFFESNKDHARYEISFTVNDRKFWQIIQAQKYTNGEEAIFVGIDITDKVEAQQALVMAQQIRSQDAKLASLGEMSANIAHEIRNPLSIIHSTCEVLEDAEDPIVTKSMSRIQKNVKRIEDIIRTFRNYSRNADHDPFEPFKLKNVYDDVMVMVSGKMKQFDIAFTIEDYPEDFTFDCRPTQIIQILTNLVKNSADELKSAPNRWIKIEFNDLGEEFELRVTDSGNGIPAQHVQKIFENYFTTKKRGEGTGLGLNISRRFAQDHKGDLWVDQENPHTSFVLKLPKKQAKSQQAA